MASGASFHRSGTPHAPDGSTVRFVPNSAARFSRRVTSSVVSSTSAATKNPKSSSGDGQHNQSRRCGRAKKGKGGGLTLEVGLDPVRRDRLGQDNDPPRGLPRDQDLSRRGIVSFGDLLDHLVLHLRGAGRTERRVGLDEDPVLLRPLRERGEVGSVRGNH